MTEVEKLKMELRDLRGVLDIVKEDRDKHLQLCNEKEIIIQMYEKDSGQFRTGHERYEKLRKLNPRQFAELKQRNIAGEGKFDELVDMLT